MHIWATRLLLLTPVHPIGALEAYMYCPCVHVSHVSKPLHLGLHYYLLEECAMWCAAGSPHGSASWAALFGTWCEGTFGGTSLSDSHKWINVQAGRAWV